MKYIYFAILFGFSNHQALAENPKVLFGGTVENGGNSVWCSFPEDDVPNVQPPHMNGNYYALDYARAIQKGRSASDFAFIKDWEEAQKRLERILREVSPELLTNFLDFAESTDQIVLPRGQRGSKLKRVWKKVTANQIEPPQADYAPPKCLAMLHETEHLNWGGAIISFRGYMRTVTRKKSAGVIRYKYQPDYLKNLQRNSGLQYSMLLTHEWLWDHTKNLEVNQAVNEFLYSKEIETMSATEIRQQLMRLGLRFL